MSDSSDGKLARKTIIALLQLPTLDPSLLRSLWGMADRILDRELRMQATQDRNLRGKVNAAVKTPQCSSSLR